MRQTKTLLLFIVIAFVFVFEPSTVFSQDTSAKPDKYLIGPQTFKEVIDKKKNLVVLDVRTPEEYEESHIKGSINVDFKNPNFLEEIQKLDKNKKYSVYCRSGKRSANSRKIMNEAGFKKVYDLDGGILAWKKQDYPVE